MALISSKLLQTLALLSSLFLVIMTNKLVHSDNSPSFSFESFNKKPDAATYQGDAQYTHAGDRLSLTNVDRSSNLPLQNSVGRLLYTKPFQFWDDTGLKLTFETTIVFYITATDDNPAEGITFFIAPSGTNIPAGSSGANLGIFDSSGKANGVFAVEIDTHIDEWDPNYRHIGIDIGSRISKANVRLPQLDQISGQRGTLTIAYNQDTVTVNVDFGTSSSFSLSYNVDLKAFVPQQVQVGISGATGDHVQYNYIGSWMFSSSLVDSNSENQYNNTYIRQSVM